MPATRVRGDHNEHGQTVGHWWIQICEKTWDWSDSIYTWSGRPHSFGDHYIRVGRRFSETSHLCQWRHQKYCPQTSWPEHPLSALQVKRGVFDSVENRCGRRLVPCEVNAALYRDSSDCRETVVTVERQWWLQMTESILRSCEVLCSMHPETACFASNSREKFGQNSLQLQKKHKLKRQLLPQSYVFNEMYILAPFFSCTFPPSTRPQKEKCRCCRYHCIHPWPCLPRELQEKATNTALQLQSLSYICLSVCNFSNRRLILSRRASIDTSRADS